MRERFLLRQGFRKLREAVDRELEERRQKKAQPPQNPAQEPQTTP